MTKVKKPACACTMGNHIDKICEMHLKASKSKYIKEKK
jgi:hypothetical protein